VGIATVGVVVKKLFVVIVAKYLIINIEKKLTSLRKNGKINRF
jgi:hypothetical protein